MHRRHRARRGATAAAVLAVLKDGPSHGYAIMEALEERSEGRWRPSPGSLYPTLKRLEHKGLVAGVDDTDPQEYAITEEGLEWVDGPGSAIPAPWEDGPGGENRAAVMELGGAMRQIGRFGTDAQRAEARELVAETTRKLYAILASGPADADDDPSDDDEG